MDIAIPALPFQIESLSAMSTSTFSLARLFGTLTLALVSTVVTNLAHAAVLKAEYLFENTFTSSVTGAPALVAVNPYGTNTFLSDTVFGQLETVYATNGTGSNQAGLTLDTTGLIPTTSYSLEMVFAVTGGADRYRRLVRTGVENYEDNGIYVDPDRKLNLYSYGSNPGSAFSLNAYHHMVATVGGNQVQLWLDGNLSQTVNGTSAMNIASPSDLMYFFLDEREEYTNAKTALIRLWDAPLSNGEITDLAARPLESRVVVETVPEPSTLALFMAGLGLLGWMVPRRVAIEGAL